MKGKLLLVIFIVVLATGVLFYSNINGSKEALKDKIEVASKDYFKKYVSINDSKSVYTITLGMLENSAEDYDLSGLEKCDKEKTQANVTVDYNTGGAKKVEIELSC